MEFLKNIEWFIASEPKTAVNKETREDLSKDEMDIVIFDKETYGKKISLSFPLNDNLSFSETRDVTTPVTVKKLLTTIYKFYRERLEEEYYDKAFEGNEEWKEEVIEEEYDGNASKLKKYDVFTQICTPDFCGLELDENTGEYCVGIGPE